MRGRIGPSLRWWLSLWLILLIPVGATGAELESFRAAPESLCGGESVEFAANVTALPDEEHRLEIALESAGEERSRLDFGIRRGPAVLISSWVPPGTGPWRARALLQNGGPPLTAESAFAVGECPPAAESRATGGFALWPRWVELRRGESALFDVALSAPAAPVPVRLEGPAASWGSVSPPAVEPRAGELAVFALALRAPPNATPGRTSLQVRVGEEVLDLPVQVKPGTPGDPLPAVLRSLVQRGESTEVVLRAVNGNTAGARIELLEAVAPELATSAAELQFRGEPPQTVSEDPLVLRWTLEDVSAGEERRISYQVDRTLPQGLPAWPIRQVNLIPGTGEGGAAIRLVRLEADPLVSGRTGLVRIEVRNLRPDPVVVNASVEVPPGWGTAGEGRLALPPGDTGNLTLRVSSPFFASGSAVSTLRLSAGSYEIERSFSLTVAQDTGPVLALVLLAVAAWGVYRLQRRRRAVRKSETLLQLREMRRRLR